MADALTLVIATIVIALVFDFGNGMNDAANAISTIVATKVLSFRAATLLAMVFEISGVFIFTTAVAKTIGAGIVKLPSVTTEMVFAALIGAIIWLYLTTYFGLPISASHSLIGGLIGTAIVANGFQSLILPGILVIAAFIFAAPIIGMFGGMYFSVLIQWLFKKSMPSKVDKYFKKLQLVSASAYALSHGSNDAQKTIGVISLLLFSAGFLGSEFYIPFWVILISYVTIGLGTFIGGWKVVKTMGMKITKLKPVDGFCAETSGAATIIMCTLLGIPVSTTHVIAGSITGVGSTKRAKAVRWGIARRIVWAWLLTIPASAIVGALTYYISSAFL